MRKIAALFVQWLMARSHQRHNGLQQERLALDGWLRRMEDGEREQMVTRQRHDFLQEQQHRHQREMRHGR